MSTKSYILRNKRLVDTFRQEDEKYLKMKTEHSELRAKINQTFAQIKNLEQDYPEEEERSKVFATLDDTMTQLSELIKMTEQEIDEYCLEKFPNFKAKYPTIFKLFLEGNVQPRTLNHVLDTLTKVEEGQISLERGKEIGYRRYQKPN